MNETKAHESAKEFENNPQGWARLWSVEMASSKDALRKWTERGDKVEKRFLDDREGNPQFFGDTRVNLFTANVQTLRALLYGKTPNVDVKRRFADPNDDVARTAGEILQRLLNTDIERDSDTYAEALENALSDRLIPGLGVVRCRYAAEFKDKEVAPIYLKHPAIDPMTGQPNPLAGQTVTDEQGAPHELAPGYVETVKTSESVAVDYVHWRDFRWSPARTWDEVRWVAFKAPMTKDQLVARFGEEVAQLVPLTAKKDTRKDGTADDNERVQPWMRAEVWEIWSKEHRKIWWWVEGHDRILDEKEDPLGLDGFFPCPRPMFANLTTSKLIPTPDFTIAQDLYDEVDSVSTRITLLERAIAARGVYDATSEEVKRVLSEAVLNELIPVNDFAIFKEKGGLQSVIDWLPLEMFVNALDKLREYRQELMALLFQVTGMSDIMRGQASAGATATEQALKAKFASTRVQEFQNEFARFASDAQSIKAEIISKHYSPETILKGANVQFMLGSDQQLAMQAVELIKSDVLQYRVEVKPESIAMADMAAVKQERAEFLMAVSQFFQSMVPVVQVAPFATPFMLQILQWSIAGFRGGSTVEGVLDQMVISAQQALQQQAMQPPQPDPKLLALKAKMEADKQKNQMDLAAKAIGLKVDQQKASLDMAVAKQKAAVDMATAMFDHRKAIADHEMTLREYEAKVQGEERKAALKEVEDDDDVEDEKED